MTDVIPNAALDDRHAFVGMTGSGKTFSAGTAVERILDRKGRVIIPDPLGVWYGLRLMADGVTPSPYNVVIFGGPHADLPINEHAGALIGETVAGIAESCILDLSEFPSAASERRFMFHFLTALYRHANNEPVHLIFDEADMWAPERIMDKEGDAMKLHGQMQTIVRRGRIKGLISWMITQRPAALSKNCLSQVDGLIAFKLTATHDRKALGAWIEGQADRERGKEIMGSLAELQKGQAVVWIPGRGVLATQQFPLKTTFDSSKAPKRGEKRRVTKLKTLDIPALRGRLATVEAEVAANDPKALKAEIARLRKAGNDASKVAQPSAPDPKALEEERVFAYRLGYEKGYWDAARIVRDGMSAAMANAVNQYRPPEPSQERIPQKTFKSTVLPKVPSRVTPIPKTNGSRSQGEQMPGPQRKLLNVLAQFPQGRTKRQLAILAGYAHNGGAFNNPLANLRSRGWAEGSSERITITEAGVAALGSWEPLPEGDELREYWFGNLPGPPAKILRVLCDAYPEGMSKADLAKASGYEPSGGAFNNPLARLRSLELVTGKGGAEIRASEDLF